MFSNSARNFPQSPAGFAISKVLTIIFMIIVVVELTGCATAPVRLDQDDPDFVKLVEKKWDTVELSTTTAWVDYDPELETRSKINFVGGIVEIETVLPEDASDISEQGRKNIESQTRKIFSVKNHEDYNVLSDQVETGSGEAVTEQNLNQYIEKEVIPSIETDQSAYVAKDGVNRLKMKAKLKLISKHVDVRARHYFPMVKEKAKQYGLSISLIMAMIHAESHFNPYARSRGGALGMMQLIPRFGGREAYQHVFGEDKIPSKKDLFDAENNITLGTAYYYLLKSRHFVDEDRDLKKRYMAISAYNLGPTRVKRIVQQHAAPDMTDGDFFSMLTRNVPRETRNYLKKVIRLIEKYKTMENAFFIDETGAQRAMAPSNEPLPAEGWAL